MKVTLNLARIEELKEMDEPGSDEIQRQLVDLYLGSAPEKLETLTSLLQKGELDLLRKEAHSLKSTSLNMGCDQLADLCQKLESGDPNPAELIKACKEEFKRVAQELLQLYP